VRVNQEGASKSPAIGGFHHRAMPKVRDALALLQANGWQIVRTRGSHRQLGHPMRPGLVTLAGKPNADLPPGTWRSILRQAGIEDWRRQ
jgi:predicted RNA binding protein YcfA (HicA-like mRNA interferase family)